MAFYSSVLSEYELREMALKINDVEEDTFTHADCVGTFEEEAETLTVTKNCRGKVAKKRTTGTGSGTLTISAHWPQALLVKLYDMSRDDLVEGVAAYGQDSRHKEATLVAKVLDEDGNVKYLAYPKVNANTLARTIENGGEEVAEREIEFSYMPDENGYGVYECCEADLATDTNQLKTKWMTAWTPELMQKSPAA